MISSRLLLTAAWLCASAALAAKPAPCAQQPATDPFAPAVPAPPPLSREAQVIVKLLRDTRAKDAPPSEQTVAKLVEPGEVVVAPLLDLLVARKLPALQLEERVQSLSVPQREMVLQALSRFSAARVVTAIEARQTPEGALPERIAALYVYSTFGRSKNLPRVLELAIRQGEGELAADTGDAFEFAVSQILLRDPDGFTWLRTEAERTHAALHQRLVFAVGATRNPLGIGLFARLLAFHRELAEVILPHARLLGRSPDVEANRALAAEVGNFLDPSRVELCSAAARTLAELGDSDHVGRMVELLESEHAPVRDSALWSLQKISRLTLPADPGVWGRWYQGEQRFWTEQAPKYLQQVDHGARAARSRAISELAARTLHRDEIAAAIAMVLGGNDKALRLQACEALEVLRSPSCVSQLVDALEDDDQGVRQSAHRALVTIVGKPLPLDRVTCRQELRL